MKYCPMHRDMIVSGVRIFAVAELAPRTVIGANSVIRKGTMSQDSMPERRLCSKKLCQLERIDCPIRNRIKSSRIDYHRGWLSGIVRSMSHSEQRQIAAQSVAWTARLDARKADFTPLTMTMASVMEPIKNAQK